MEKGPNMTRRRVGRSYLTSHQVAQMFMVTPVTVRQWVQKGLLKGMSTAGGHLRFTMSQLESFAKQRGLTMLPLSDGAVRILVVDDDRLHCDVIKRLLGDISSDIVVETAHDGFEAGWKAQVFKPDIILLDLMMPGLDGYEVCQRIKDNPLTRHIRVIAMTGYASGPNVERIVAAGAEECLSKPIETATLISVIGIPPMSRGAPVQRSY